MQPEVRRQIVWIVITAIIASLVVFASYRRHEMDQMRKIIAAGRPEERIATVRRLVAKEKLAEALQDQPRWVQDHAVEAVAEIGSQEALFQLTGAIYLLDDPVAARAKAVLTRFDLMAIGPLVKALKDKDANVRAGAADPLVSIGESVISSLLPLMDAWDQYVRDGVVAVFGRIGLPVAPDLIAQISRTEPLAEETPQRFLWKRDTAVRSILAMKAVGIQPVIDNLITHKEEDVRALACQMLGQIADQTLDSPIPPEEASRVLEPLLTRLNSDPAWTVRRKAALALGGLMDVGRLGGAVPALISHLKDPRPEVKAASAEALGRLGDPAAAGPLVNTLLTNRTGAVREIVVALERIGRPALPALVPALATPELEVRKAATEAVAVIGTPDAVVPLAGMLKDSDVTVRRLASDALRSLADARVVPQLVASLSDPDWHVYYACRDALANVGPAAVPGLIQALGSGNSRAAHMAEQALAKIGGPAVNALVAALVSPNVATRQWAAVALGDIGEPAVEATIALLNDTTKPAYGRAAAADALGRTGVKKKVFESLSRVSATQEPEVRKAALQALVRLADERSTQPLVAALEAPTQDVRSVAMHLLMNWRLGDLRKTLEAALKRGDLNARRRAAIVLAQQTISAATNIVGESGLEMLEKAVKPPAETETLLAAAVADPKEQADVRKAAVQALGYVGTERALEVLKPLLVPGNPLATEAARAVAHIGRRITEELYRSGEQKVLVRHRQASEPARMLLDLLKSTKDDALRLSAAVGLSLMNDDPVWALLDELAKADDEIRVWIVAILGAIGKPASDASLDARGTIKDPKVKEWVTVALPLIGDAQALDLLDHLGEDEQPNPAYVEAGAKIKERILAARAGSAQ